MPKPITPLDRRVVRTRDSIRQALISLIAEKGFESISVQEILDRANVGRSTFYAHFTGKSQLLLDGFETLECELRTHVVGAKSQETATPARFHFSLPLFQHAADHRRVFRAMVGRRSGLMVQTRMQKLIVDLVENELDSFRPPLPAKGPVRSATIQLCAGACYALLVWWIDGHSGLSADEIDNRFQEFVRNGMHPAA